MINLFCAFLFLILGFKIVCIVPSPSTLTKFTCTKIGFPKIDFPSVLKAPLFKHQQLMDILFIFKLKYMTGPIFPYLLMNIQISRNTYMLLHDFNED